MCRQLYLNATVISSGRHGAVRRLKSAAAGIALNMDYRSGLELFVAHVVRELRRRGLFRQGDTGTTLRDHLALSRPSVTRPLANVA